MLGIILLVAIVSAQSRYDYDIRSEFAGVQRSRSADVQPVEFTANEGGILAVRSPILDPEVADQLEGNGWLDVIPGTPGKDYPNYEIVPQTSFTCRGRTPGGYYADVETRCQVFHVCDADGRKNSFLCPSGSIFNQKYFICDWWYDFECDDAPELYSLNDEVKRGDRASRPKGPGQGYAREESDNGCCAEDEEGNAHGTFDGDLSLAGTGEGSIGYARRKNKSRGYQSNEKEAEEENRGGNERQGQGRDERNENSPINEKPTRTNQFATNGFARVHRTGSNNNNAQGRQVKVGATFELKSQSPVRSSDMDEIRRNLRQGQLETARESLQARDPVENAGGNGDYSRYGTHQDRRLASSRHSSGPRADEIEHLDDVEPNFEHSTSADHGMLDAGQDASSSWNSSGSGHETFEDRRFFPRNRELKDDNERPFRKDRNASSYGDSSGLNYDESERLDDSKSGSSGPRHETRRQNLADANHPKTFHQRQTHSELGSLPSRLDQEKPFVATSSRHSNNAVSDREVISNSGLSSSTVSHAQSSHSGAFNQRSTDIGSGANDSQSSSPNPKRSSKAEKTSSQHFGGTSNGRLFTGNSPSDFAGSSSSNQQQIADSAESAPNSRRTITEQVVRDRQRNLAKISVSNLENSSHSEAAREKHREDDHREALGDAGSSFSWFGPEKSSRIQRPEKSSDEINANSRKFNVGHDSSASEYSSVSDHRKSAHRRVSTGRVSETSDGRATVVHRSSKEDDEIPHYDVPKIYDFVGKNVGETTNKREFNFTEYPTPSHPRYPSRSNAKEFFPSGVISHDSKQSQDKGASVIKRFNSTVGSPSSASAPRANVKESSHSTATEEISRRNNGQSRQRTSEGLQNGLGNGYPSAGRARELPGSAVIAGTIAPGTVYGSSVEKSSTTTISQAPWGSFGTRTPGMITDARSSVSRIDDVDALERFPPFQWRKNDARDFQSDDHFHSNFTNDPTTSHEQPSDTFASSDREKKKSERSFGTKRVNRTGRKKSLRLIDKNVEGYNPFPRTSAHEDNDYPMKLRFLPLL